MALIRANDLDVVEAHIAMPKVGAWVADLAVSAEDASQFEDRATVSIKCADGIELTGSVAPGRAAEFIGSVGVRVVAGKGGLGKAATPKYYANAKLGDVVDGLLRDSGEALSTTADRTILAKVVEAWLVIKQPVAAALTVALSTVSPGSVWRMLPDGKLWIGAESWPDLEGSYDFQVLVQRPADRTSELGAATPLIAPGMNVPDLGHAAHVEHWVTSTGVRTVMTCETEQSTDRVKGMFLKLARAAIPGIDYLGLYDAKVVKQSGQKFDVQPDDIRLTGMTNVPLRNGIPGLEVQVAPGAYVQVGWSNGDPRQPFVALWKGGETATEITITGTMVNIGGTGGEALVKKSEFDGHTHKYNPGPSAPAESVVPTVLATGTTNMKGK